MSGSPDIAGARREVLAGIARHARAHGRDPKDILLLAVGKTKPVAALEAAIRAGQRYFGENYVDEALGKIDAIGRVAPNGEPLEWHFIGTIQSRRTGDLADRFDWVHGLDREKIARRLSARRMERIELDATVAPLNVCLQVNIDDESTKSGVAPDELHALADVVAQLPGLALRGLMAIPAPCEGLDAQRVGFARLATLKDDLARRHPSLHPGLDTLSCGMSADLEAAIAEGATIVRVGTALFGARAPKT